MTTTRAALLTLLFAACGPGVPGLTTATTGGGGTTGGTSGCGGAIQGSCAYSDGTQCEEISGFSSASADGYKSDCQGHASRVYSSGSCSHTNAMGQKAVGGCALPGGGGCFITWYFPPADAAQEQSGCQSISGTWMSP